ncbi:hypothetical protein [Marinicrinis lubricantis]|uniref:Uncharacterized protein n=1 Tax=Marinicrinis lubricantis TaxID=2086470 RepID=A0ABW1IPB7_9BACL
MIWLLMGAALFILLWISYKGFIKMKDKREASKVIQMSLHRHKPSKEDKQTCSFCRKKSKKLSFYAAENGKVIGVCDVCRPQAERRALPRL